MQLSRQEFLQAYETMRLIREFEEALLRLHGQGEHPWLRARLGVAGGGADRLSLSLRHDDQIVSTHRGHGDPDREGRRDEGMYSGAPCARGRLLPRQGRLDARDGRLALVRSARTGSSVPAFRSLPARLCR